MDGAPVQNGFDTGRVVRRAVGVLKRNFLAFLLLSILLLGLPTFAINYLSDRPDRLGGLFGTDARRWLFLGANLLVLLLGGFLAQAAITHGALGDLNGKRTTFGQSLMLTVKDSPALLLLGIITTLGIMAGFALLIIPGVVLALAWSVTVPVRVAEHQGVMQALSRSRALTKGRRGEVFGLIAVYAIASAVASWLIELLAAALGAGAFQALITTAVDIVSGVVSAVGLASIYCELRWSQEGTPTDELVEVFA